MQFRQTLYRQLYRKPLLFRPHTFWLLREVFLIGSGWLEEPPPILIMVCFDAVSPNFVSTTLPQTFTFSPTYFLASPGGISDRKWLVRRTSSHTNYGLF